MTPFFQVLISTGPEITVNLRRFEGYRPKGVKKGVQKGSKRPFLAKNGHFLDPFFDKKWSKKWSDFAPEQCKIRVFPDPVSAKNRSKMVKNQDLRPPKMAKNDPFLGQNHDYARLNPSKKGPFWHFWPFRGRFWPVRPKPGRSAKRGHFSWAVHRASDLFQSGILRLNPFCNFSFAYGSLP